MTNIINILGIEVHKDKDEWWFKMPNGSRHAQKTAGHTEKEMLSTAKLSVMNALGYSQAEMMKNYGSI